MCLFISDNSNIDQLIEEWCVANMPPVLYMHIDENVAFAYMKIAVDLKFEITLMKRKINL